MVVHLATAASQVLGAITAITAAYVQVRNMYQESPQLEPALQALENKFNEGLGLIETALRRVAHGNLGRFRIRELERLCGKEAPAQIRQLTEYKKWCQTQCLCELSWDVLTCNTSNHVHNCNQLEARLNREIINVRMILN